MFCSVRFLCVPSVEIQHLVSEPCDDKAHVVAMQERRRRGDRHGNVKGSSKGGQRVPPISVAHEEQLRCVGDQYESLHEAQGINMKVFMRHKSVGCDRLGEG